MSLDTAGPFERSIIERVIVARDNMRAAAKYFVRAPRIKPKRWSYAPAPLPSKPCWIGRSRNARDFLILTKAPLVTKDEMALRAFSEAAQPQWKTILVEVSRQHGVSVADLMSARRAAHIVKARHEAMYRMRHETTMSMPQIGKRLGGKDHTTVMWGVRKHAERTGVAQ